MGRGHCLTADADPQGIRGPTDACAATHKIGVRGGVSDVDAAAAKVDELGGTLRVRPFVPDVGRMAVVGRPHLEGFSVRGPRRYLADLDTDGYEWVLRPAGVAGVIPTNDARASVFAGGNPAQVGREA